MLSNLTYKLGHSNVSRRQKLFLVNVSNTRPWISLNNHRHSIRVLFSNFRANFHARFKRVLLLKTHDFCGGRKKKEKKKKRKKKKRGKKSGGRMEREPKE